ncbi:MAG: cell division protein SepF, partial [Pseudomonadota bacterium]|nr:cell division protein SepF [Pseudomonadota bacterium]
VILNLTMMEPDQAQRAVDFVAGGTFAIDGHQERVGESIFLFAPSCVTVTNGQIKLDWKRTNWRTHEALVKRAKTVFRKAEYPMVLSRAFDHRIPSHQCGTARFGIDPMQTVLDLHCRAHDHPNFFVMDSSFLPTSAAVNPALTIAAQALRVCDHINQERKAA